MPQHSEADAVIIPNEDLSDVILNDRAFFTCRKKLSSSWILDSGCSAHISSRKKLLSPLTLCKGVVTIANGRQISMEGKGNLSLNLWTSTGSEILATIRNVLNVSELKVGNLISESQLELDGNLTVLQNGRRRVLFKDKEWMFAVLDSSKQFVVQENNEKTLFTSYHEAHECFGHSGDNVMTNLRKLYPKKIPSKPKGFYCPVCTLAKVMWNEEG